MNDMKKDLRRDRDKLYCPNDEIKCNKSNLPIKKNNYRNLINDSLNLYENLENSDFLNVCENNEANIDSIIHMGNYSLSYDDRKN